MKTMSKTPYSQRRMMSTQRKLILLTSIAVLLCGTFDCYGKPSVSQNLKSEKTKVVSVEDNSQANVLLSINPGELISSSNISLPFVIGDEKLVSLMDTPKIRTRGISKSNITVVEIDDRDEKDYRVFLYPTISDTPCLMSEKVKTFSTKGKNIENYQIVIWNTDGMNWYADIALQIEWDSPKEAYAEIVLKNRNGKNSGLREPQIKQKLHS